MSKTFNSHAEKISYDRRALKILYTLKMQSNKTCYDFTKKTVLKLLLVKKIIKDVSGFQLLD
jgi:AAA+ ATPase superfamily predicted ATPase